MGGNSRAVDRSTGEVVSVSGKLAYAERLVLDEVDLGELRESIFGTLASLSRTFEEIKGFPLWPLKTNFSEGHCFMGSARNLCHPDGPDDKKLLKHMPTIGDVDVAVPQSFLGDLWDVLAMLERNSLGPMLYLGQNRVKLRRPSINAVFKWKTHFLQIDFVGTHVSAETGDVDAFVQFAHSSPWEDRVVGVKGVAHKYLLQTLTWAVSYDPNIIILTDKSPVTPNEARVKVLHEPPRPMSFSVDRGIRIRLEQQFLPNGSPLIVLGKRAYKEIPTSQSSYITDLGSIFMLLFGQSPEGDDMKKFESFQGLLTLCKKYLDQEVLDRAIMFMFFYKLYGRGQALSRDSADEDKRTKKRICDVIKDMTFLKIDPKIVSDYYKNYKEREISE